MTAKFRTAFFGQFFTCLRKDSVASYASIWTLFSPSVRGPDVLCNTLNIFVVTSVGGVAPQDSQICGGNFRFSAAELCQILCIVTIEIVINSTRIMGIWVTISCRYCIAVEVMLLFLVLY